MNALDVLRAGEAGRDNSQSMFDQFARQRAGNALAQGDYQGGANALLRGGMLRDGMAVQAAGQRQSGGDIQEAAEKLEFMGKAARMLRQLPMEARPQAREQLMGTFQAMGLPPEVLQQIAQAELSDQNLDVFAGETEKAKVRVQQSGRYTVGLEEDTGRELWRHEMPADSQTERLPTGYEMTPDGPRIADWYVQGEQRKSGARRAPARSGGGGRGGGGGGGGARRQPWND
jgi:hypothetical protein